MKLNDEDDFVSFSPSSFSCFRAQQERTYNTFFSKNAEDRKSKDIRAAIDNGIKDYMTVDMMVKMLREETDHAATKPVYKSFIDIINKCSAPNQDGAPIQGNFSEFIKSIGKKQFPKVNEILQPIVLLYGHCVGGDDLLKKYFKTNDIEQIRKYTFIAFGENRTLAGNDPLVDSIIIYAPEDGSPPIDINISSKYGSGYQFSLKSLDFAIKKCASNYGDDYFSNKIKELNEQHARGREPKIITDILQLIRSGLSYQSIIQLGVELGIICDGDYDTLNRIAKNNQQYVTGNSTKGNAIESLKNEQLKLSNKAQELYRAFCIYDRRTVIDTRLWEESCIGKAFNYTNDKARRNVIENHNGIGLIFWPIVHQITEYLNQSKLFTEVACDFIDKGRVIQISTSTATSSLKMELIPISDPNKVKAVTCISRNHQSIKLEMKRRR